MNDLTAGYFAEEGHVGNYVKAFSDKKSAKGVSCVKHQRMAGFRPWEMIIKTFLCGEKAMKAWREKNNLQTSLK